MKDLAHIFLGANSSEGFYSLYDQLLTARLDDLLILKGGPGCGKSSFMRRVAEALTEAGEEAIFIHCSGDPVSLDGVIFPALRTALVDGTSPHVLDCVYAVACERYVDLTRFYNVEGVKARREEVILGTDTYRAAYRDAYRALRAASAVEVQRRAEASAAMDFDRLARRIDGIARRELRGKSGRRGSVQRAFLGGTTHRGVICRFDTVDALCPRVYALCDSYGLGAQALETLCDAALQAGENVLLCPDPDHPEQAQHLLLPRRGLAFVTSTDRLPYPGEPYRRLRLDAMAEASLTRAQKSKLRFAARIEHSLRDEAVKSLDRAKHAHDELETLYNPFVNFAGVYALAAQEAQCLLNRRGQTERPGVDAQLS
ncbi:MAG: hypothetical protein II079_04035 [Oscillospiraceae bacterium]|nr:hypothetical protein [Oscillospiraceae bacterium]